MSPKEFLGVLVRGMAMGAADVVPGVSGGTIAFITGIYPRLIASLTSFDIETVKLVLGFDIKSAWQRVDGNFLLALFAGIGCSIFSLSHLIAYMLEEHTVVLWAFFFGLILASALWMLAGIKGFRWADAVFLLLGIGFILAISLSPATQLTVSLPIVFVAGFIAISAMLLPGVSGSFLLLLMGLYASTIEAVKTLDIQYILVFALGAVCGFLVFSRVIDWLLKTFYRPTLVFLIGLLFGSLYVVWPWKVASGEMSSNTTPATFAMQVGEPMLLWAAVSFVLGIAVVFGLEWVFGRNKRPAQDTPLSDSSEP